MEITEPIKIKYRQERRIYTLYVLVFFHRVYCLILKENPNPNPFETQETQETQPTDKNGHLLNKGQISGSKLHQPITLSSDANWRWGWHKHAGLAHIDKTVCVLFVWGSAVDHRGQSKSFSVIYIHHCAYATWWYLLYLLFSREPCEHTAGPFICEGNCFHIAQE